MPYDHSIPRDKKNAPARRQRSQDIALALVKERGRISTGDLKRALQAEGLPYGLLCVKRAMHAAAETGEAAVETNAIGRVRYLALAGQERAPLQPAEGGPLEWVAQALALAESSEPWRLRRGGWVKWSDVIRASGRCRDTLREPVEAAERAGELQTIARGDRSPRRLWARPTPRGWRRFKSVLRATRWLLTDGARRDNETAYSYLLPTAARPRELSQPQAGMGFIPWQYVEDMLPSTMREPGNLARLRKRLRRALRMLRQAGLVELVRHDSLVWVRAVAGQPVAASCHGAVTTPTPTPPAQPAPEPFAPELACVVEDLVAAEAARRFGMPAWML